ncbi:von Willebrand factor A domain-containing protein 5A, partial [Armadillidium vulgare]
MEKKKAKEVYDKAVEEGHTAILGSEDRFSGDLIHLALGNLPKGEKADLRLKMITQDGGTNFDHDWSFQIYYNTVHKPNCLQMAGDRTSTGLMKDDIIMLNLFPEVPFEGYSPHNEIILVVDRSGSMGGSKIAKAKTTLLLFLKSLPPGCRFNVISFGSTFNTLFESQVSVTRRAHCKKLLNCKDPWTLTWEEQKFFQPFVILLKEPIPVIRSIIILTDGEVWNHDQIFDLIQRHADETRVFAVGIGDGASTALVEGMATAGKGRHEMVAHEDQLQIRVMGLIGNMLQENVKDLTVECKVAPQQDVKLVPKIPPNVFGGQHLILYARLKPNSKIESVKVGWKIGEDQFNCELKEDDCKS